MTACYGSNDRNIHVVVLEARLLQLHEKEHSRNPMQLKGVIVVAKPIVKKLSILKRVENLWVENGKISVTCLIMERKRS